MSDVLITYKHQNKNDRYHLLPSAEQATVDNVITNFIQELITQKSSSLFNRSYGTDFIDDLGSQINIYKVDYLLQNSIGDLKEKYGIISISTGDAILNKSNGFLEVSLKLEMSEVAVETHFDFMYNGLFTDQTIVEMD